VFGQPNEIPQAQVRVVGGLRCGLRVADIAVGPELSADRESRCRNWKRDTDDWRLSGWE